MTKYRIHFQSNRGMHKINLNMFYKFWQLTRILLNLLTVDPLHLKNKIIHTHFIIFIKHDGIGLSHHFCYCMVYSISYIAFLCLTWCIEQISYYWAVLWNTNLGIICLTIMYQSMIITQSQSQCLPFCLSLSNYWPYQILVDTWIISSEKCQ